MVSLYCTQKKKMNFGSDCMIKDDIYELRQKLNDAIVEGKSYDVIYNLSIELDVLISEYYNKELKKKAKTKEMK